MVTCHRRDGATSCIYFQLMLLSLNALCTRAGHICLHESFSYNRYSDSLTTQIFELTYRCLLNTTHNFYVTAICSSV